MRKGSQHAAAVAATLPRSKSSSNVMIASPNSAPAATSEDVFEGNSQAAASSSSGRRQQRLSRGSLSKVSPSSLPSGPYTSQQPQQQQHRWQRQMKKGPRHHRGGGGGRREAQLKGLPGSSVCVTGMSTAPNAVKSAVDAQAQLTLSSSITGTAISDGNKADPSASSVPCQQQQQQQQRPVDENKRTKGKRDSKPRKAQGGASTHLWEDVHPQPKPRRHLESQQNRRRIPARGSEASAGVGNVQGLPEEPEEKEGTVSCKPRRVSVFSSPATTVATAAEGTLENEELQPAVGTRRVARRSAKDMMETPSRRPAVTEGGGRSRHRRRLSPAHPVASSPAVSRDGSINDAVGGAVVDKLTQPFSTLWHVPPDSAEAVSEDGSGRPLHAGNRQSRKPRHMSTSVQQAQPPSGSGAAAGMSPVTAVASFSTRPPPLLLVPQDPIIVAQQMRYTAQAVVAESALPDPPSTAMQLAEFSSAKGSITDLCVGKAVLPKSADVATHALDPALLHSDPVKDMATPSSPSPPAVVVSPSLPQQSEEDKQLSRRGLRFGALPFYPTSTASLVLAMNPAASTNGGDASLSSFGTTVPSPQSLMGSYSMSPLRSPPLTHPISSPQGDSMRNHSRSSTGGLMSGQSTFAAELTAATATPWPLTVIAPSHSSPSSSIGRDDTDFDATSSGTSVPIKFPGHRAAMRRSALMVTNTATGACVSPATVVTPSGSPTALWNGSSGHGLKRRTSGHTSGASSITAAAAATSPGGTGYHSTTHSGGRPEGGVVREFPQAPCPVVNCTTELHQSQQQQPHSMRSPRLMSESDPDCVQHNRVAVSDVVAKDEGTLVDTLFADVKMIEDDESEVDGDDLLSSRGGGGGGGGERRAMQPVPSSIASVGGSPLLASPPDVRTPHSATQQLQHRATPFSVGARVLGKEAGGQVFGGGYWYPSGPWAGTDATGGGGGSASTGTGSYRGGSGAVGWRGLSTPPHRSRDFSASCASVASTMSLIDPKQPQVDGAAYDMMGEDDEWEINSSAYADSLDEAQIQWIEEQLRATENPAGYF
ncbi:hypothetical protein, conserved [Leishmania tarentolae]|uniref:Uncharacterized protein n=1 Tax=Leishmania tarentolae TaxID=5689 RepID=A0A640K952_LEITA|nr:hypothetical protein, conserved [Leishmania tarentolae]